VTNARAEALLDKQGIKYEREPDWIEKGQKPDFYCRGRSNFWCEVKTLVRLPDDEDRNRALTELRNRTAGIPSSGYGIAYIRSALSPRDAKAAANLLKRAVPRLEASDAPQMAVAMIPGDAKRDSFVRFSITTEDQGTVEFHSCESLSGKYGVPRDMLPKPQDQIIELQFSSGSEKEVSAEDVIKVGEDFRVAVAVHPDNTPFEVIAVMPTGGAKKLDNPGRIREAVSEANDQFKNAIHYKTGPCLLMIFQDGLDVPDDLIIKSALYGNLKYEFSKGHPEKGKLILDQDGAWNSTKNRTTSAVMYVRNSGEPLIIHNYSADRPLPAGLFSCREIAVVSDGTFDEVNFPGGIAGWIPSCRQRAFRTRQKERARSAQLTA
jgi:hypothetical protein